MIEAYRPIGMSITGMDGSGKSSAYGAFVETIPKNLTVVRVGRFCSVIRSGEEKIIGKNISKVLDSFHTWTQDTKKKRIVAFANAMWVLYSWRFQEKKLTKEFRPDLVLALRDPYIDPIVYAAYYIPSFFGSRSIEEQMRILKGLHGAPINNTVVFLDVEPDVAVERINKRLLDEANSRETVERAERLHLHENQIGLVGIRKIYDNVLDHFQTHHGVDVIRVDTTTRSKSEVAEIVRATLLRPFGKTT